MPWLSALLQCLGRRRRSDDLTVFSGESPSFEAKMESPTFVNCINGENAIIENHPISETKRISQQGGRDQNTNTETKGMATYNEIVSDQNTASGNTDTETRDLEPPSGSDQGTVVEIPCMSNDDIFPCPSFVNGLTGERLVDLVQVTTISLDYCDIKGAETRIPSSDKNKIEVLFHHGGENIWVYVPYDYVKDRDDFK